MAVGRCQLYNVLELLICSFGLKPANNKEACMVDLVVMDIPPFDRWTEAHLLPLVSPERREKIRGYRDDGKAAQSLWGELLTRGLACSLLGLTNRDIVVATGPHGKPFLPDYPELHFNVSHSGTRVLCVTDTKPVGVDMELMRPMDMDVARIWFSPDEYACFMAACPADRLEQLYEIWTLKESFAKACGLGFNLDPKSFTIMPVAGNSATVLAAQAHQSRFFRTYRLDGGYRVAACACGDHFPNQVRHMAPATLLGLLGVAPYV